ncbi:hypothetical protein [Flavobacterium xinjiangense]|uniref:Uncharacterized protein n=1 Tax=Flavobacterium xinjiangense TaxID=178356 RepID=A0A1M7P6S0_9FLAO|nr:hypothetical protein [Flavobacterium xinjiangense]SHN12279.1 hypothetical protein SAMN05216269_11435 [Flavobacterium xinjiangense]
MKKLEDFECEKIEIDTINGGNAPEDHQTWCQLPGSEYNQLDGVD